jgi:hypothetical protein
MFPPKLITLRVKVSRRFCDPLHFVLAGALHVQESWRQAYWPLQASAPTKP